MDTRGNVAAILTHSSRNTVATLAQHGYADAENGVNYYPTPHSYRKQLERHGFTVERIDLISRPTPLAEGGMAAWLRTFRSGVLTALPENLRETVIAETCALLAPALCDEDGNWTADYVRLRFIARA